MNGSRLKAVDFFHLPRGMFGCQGEKTVAPRSGDSKKKVAWLSIKTFDAYRRFGGKQLRWISI
jgi:hypothetical protein